MIRSAPAESRTCRRKVDQCDILARSINSQPVDGITDISIDDRISLGIHHAPIDANA